MSDCQQIISCMSAANQGCQVYEHDGEKYQRYCEDAFDVLEEHTRSRWMMQPAPWKIESKYD